MRPVIVNPLEYPEWDDLLLSNDECSLFHASCWARVLRESYGYKPLYFVSTNHGELTVLIPLMEVKSLLTGKRGVSLPFTDYCDAIVPKAEQPQDILHSLIDEGRKRRWKYLEMRCGNDIAWNHIPSSVYYGHMLDLTEGEGAVLSHLRDSTRRNIRKADMRGVRVALNPSAESMAEFYRLNCRTRKMHGLPPQPYRFFKCLYDFVISKGHGLMACAIFEEKMIAGAIYLHWGNRAIYKYGASDRRYQSLRANNLIMWEAVRWYIQNDFTSLCLGRTEPENNGLLQFKSGWGAVERSIRYYRYDLEKQKFVHIDSGITGFHNRIFRSIPLPLLRATGDLLYRHMG
jgi:hypothetical protein